MVESAASANPLPDLDRACNTRDAPSIPSRARRRWRFHDLRRAAPTLAADAGATLREVMERLGHSSTAAAIRYQHVLTDRDAAVARSLDRLITGGNGTYVARGPQNASLETQEAGHKDPA